MSNYHILFIFEGESSEGNITKTMNRLFFTEHVVICCAFCQDIYHLQRKIEEDPDLDLFVLLQELEVNKEILGSFSRNDFAEIYLFFDYDGHATKAD